ncbi:MAG: hypothetical protein K0S25_1997 [Bacillus sp. (in: firmicutes)]|nr:hypothetical protein [Bacillus sp. (in: firmicutes)]
MYSSNEKDENNDFIEANASLRDEDTQAEKYIFFGESSIFWFVYTIETNDFAELDKPSEDFIKSYNIFNDMLVSIFCHAIN